ncbi:hypothetical protein H6G17_04750 [Chroococcidiopsis sp. FACHB-1243]|uniref:asparagine synthase-related protein n=1 Tax=Chroococcidiopsis sp. [FACHB-1243] TaxID=2692781 RepID=UPI00177E04BB|nr:asparagine synthase-related protein [Chroococcidiopsis sp. [FACHB-1243]]MBD2304827.1 hypothetical protein [Chroococcidiopsis sp. [FACHB-1243]]
MAGLYAVIGNVERNRIVKAAQRLSFFSDEDTQIIHESGIAVAWVSHDDPSLFGSACDPQTGVRVITSGRVAWDEPDWQRAETMHQYKGGLSNRLILERYLSGGVAAVERHNGAAVVLIWDPRQQCIHLLTDHFGFHPVFLYYPQRVEGCVISTFPDAIADDRAVQTTADYVSMAEFLREWQATPPHTYYNEIKYAGAASHWCWNISNHTSNCREYWKPFQNPPSLNFETAVEELSEAVTNAIRIRTLPRLAPVTIYTSGGLDSRVLLFSAADKSCVHGVNLYDAVNQEANLAQQLCDAAGVKYVGFARDDDYYPRWMRQGVRLSGAMWSAEDNHFLGTRDLIQQIGTRTVMSACATDLLFKGYTLDKEHRRLMGRTLPIFKYKNSRTNSFLPYPEYQQLSSPTKFNQQIDERFRKWFEGTPSILTSDEDRLRVEDKRSRPVCYVSALSGQVMFRIFPYDTFLADRAIADCYSRIPAQWKLNTKLWGTVVARICSSANVTTSYGWRPNASHVEKLLVRARSGMQRRLGLTPKINNQGPATDGSWPNLGWYICHSSTLRQMWETTPLGDRQLMTDLWGSNPWQVPLEQWAKSPYDFFRIVTLLNYWSVRYETKYCEEMAWQDCM